VPDRVEDARHVVVQETADVGGQAGPGAGPVLHPGERAGQAGGHHEDQPGGRGDLQPDQPRPAPRGEAAEQAQGQEREVQCHGGSGDGFEEHSFTVLSRWVDGSTAGTRFGHADVEGTPRGALDIGKARSAARQEGSGLRRYGVVNPRVYSPLPEEATTTYR
jgi:hypothetical protein